MKKIMKNIVILSVFIMIFSSTNVFAAAAEINAAGTEILNAILWAGYAISLGMVVFIGIKYILGAADAKANMKSAIVNWLIGAFLVFMCTTIAGWVVAKAGADESGNGLANQIIHAAD